MILGNIFKLISYAETQEGGVMGIDLARIDDIVAKRGKTPDMAIPILQAIQEEFRYVPLEALEHIAKTTQMTETQLYGVATFFAQFRLTPVGEKIIKVCHGTACHVGVLRTDEA